MKSISTRGFMALSLVAFASTASAAVDWSKTTCTTLKGQSIEFQIVETEAISIMPADPMIEVSIDGEKTVTSFSTLEFGGTETNTVSFEKVTAGIVQLTVGSKDSQIFGFLLNDGMTSEPMTCGLKQGK